MTENRLENNENFYVLLDGYYAFANISSNNFTDNFSRRSLVELGGMEKRLVIERNRFLTNKAKWLLKIAITSQAVRYVLVNAYIQYNYFLHNHFIKANEDYVDSWPRSYAIGIFGSQKIEIHFNQLRNPLLDFEVVSGCKVGYNYHIFILIVQIYQERVSLKMCVCISYMFIFFHFLFSAIFSNYFIK
ncbi:hypothetical protein DICVIV_05806 [Dictyocaulus viviparus]|uniref:Uncharacterized protein n=1 Tax=Dictyocaulus viviparus TaxID=29172 RepID=A0A0D8XU97_DICVI|nr:hypothetical protein DICVIV_05806 [Dictyocaulus viviparus]